MVVRPRHAYIESRYWVSRQHKDYSRPYCCGIFHKVDIPVMLLSTFPKAATEADSAAAIESPKASSSSKIPHKGSLEKEVAEADFLGTQGPSVLLVEHLASKE